MTATATSLPLALAHSQLPPLPPPAGVVVWQAGADTSHPSPLLQLREVDGHSCQFSAVPEDDDRTCRLSNRRGIEHRLDSTSNEPD